MRSKHSTQRKPSTIMFYKNTFTIPKTKVHNWNSVIIAEKKDNDVYRDGLSNHISTYKRLGIDDQEFVTETQHMTSQVLKERCPKVLNLPLINFTSFARTDIPARNKLLKEAKIPQLPPNYGITDYTTTHQYEFRNHFHDKGMKPLTMPSPPWMMSRIIRSELTQNYSTAPPGIYTSLDKHTPVTPIRVMRLHRYKSFDPATGLQDFPAVDGILESINMPLSQQA